MCANMLPPHPRSPVPQPDRLTSRARGARQQPSSGRLATEQQRDQRVRWSVWLSVVNLVVASLTVLFWRGSPLVLALGAIILAELLLLALFYALARRSGRMPGSRAD
jgi:hypothetical protein